MSRSRTTIVVVALSILLILVIGLRWEGRRWWCESGGWNLWSSGIKSLHTSQHLFDPYSFTHLLHGFLFYALLWAVARRVSWGTRFVLTVALESVWELVENSSGVIDRYRAATVALGYQGDSVINALGDVTSCAAGFLLVHRLPVRWSIGLFVVIEIGLLIGYRDNLLLNILMLIHPIQAIKAWQAAAG